MTLLQRVLTPSLSRKRRKISPKLSATTVTKKDITFPSQVLQLSLKGTLCHQVSLEVKKLVLVSTTSTPVTGTREKTVKTAKVGETAEAGETAEVGKDGDESKGECLNFA